MPERWSVCTSSYKCPTCNRLWQTEGLTLGYFQYLSKDINAMYQAKELKKLTFYNTMDNEEDVWCEIDLQNAHDNFCVYLKGRNLANYIPDHPLSNIGDYFQEKTKVYEDTMSAMEIFDLLHNLYYMFDIRLLGDPALQKHPAYHMHEGYWESSEVTLEVSDGMKDTITFRHPSVASGIVIYCTLQNSLLREWFHC